MTTLQYVLLALSGASIVAMLLLLIVAIIVGNEWEKWN